MVSNGASLGCGSAQISLLSAPTMQGSSEPQPLNASAVTLADIARNSRRVNLVDIGRSAPNTRVDPGAGRVTPAHRSGRPSLNLLLVRLPQPEHGAGRIGDDREPAHAGNLGLVLHHGAAE